MFNLTLLLLGLTQSANAWSLSYHAGGQHSRSNSTALEEERAERRGFAFDQAQADVPAWGLGHSHTLTWSPEGELGIAGLDPSIRLGLALGSGPQGYEYRMGELDVMAPVPVADEISVVLNLYWPTSDQFPDDLQRVRWSGPNVFIGPQFFWEDGKSAVYLSPLIDPLWPLTRAALGAGPFRLHARLLAGGTYGVTDWLFLNAEANAVLSSTFTGIPMGELGVKAGLGLRF